ncbi:MAG: cytochrome c oxidase subunit II [Halovenus sp.]|uniref:cytochrome c oxidase subunit II n=1 Tax=Halovenus amylolytica TaxID=2500550 RepID=UPI000FE3A599
MLGTGITLSSALRHAPVAQVDQTQVNVFDSLYDVFVALGTLIGVLVITYMVYNAYKYRSGGADAEGRYDIEEEDLEGDYDVSRPQRGEIPTGKGKGGGKKLFMSFGLSAFLVLGLIIYSYSLLLAVEDTSQNQEDALEIEVTGYQFGWDYEYTGSGLESGDYDVNIDGVEADDDALVVPRGEVIQLNVTSRDVMHNYGIPEFRAKTDAMPGDYTQTWFQPEKTGVYRANCYELCGQGHSNMHGDVVVLEPDEFRQWYLAQDGTSESDLEFMESDSQ